MKIVLVHTVYRQRGGEEGVFEAERDLLVENGHEVRTFVTENADLVEMPRLRQAAATIWNGGAADRLRRFLEEDPPEVVHVHNTFPLLSPAIHHAAARSGAAVVQTLHNYRLLCPNALFFRDGRVCEECLGRAVPWPGVVHACYRDSRSASGVVAAMLATHRAVGTWTRKVDVFVALTDFARRKFIAGGLPGDRIELKPNFVPEPAAGAPSVALGGRVPSAVYVGRLSEEKGIPTLLDAWRTVDGVRLRIVGAGPLEEDLRHAIGREPLLGRVDLMGFRTPLEVAALMRDSSLLVFPSECYEGAPRTILEAYAAGLPVLASRHGSMEELVIEGETGGFFEPGDPGDLAEMVGSLFDGGDLPRLGAGARERYEAQYTPAANHARLMEIYRLAITRSRERGRR
jgi:glycosyltransferase involved in cell wall biosynthesis